MKILRVSFQNLNSLAGKWAIDFTQVEYSSNGIFAITGPTGSGKTTLLDAICLALYGRTPRLERISESTNEIMSRHTGFCFAEIDFETKKGRYRCHWSQRRAREKSTGRLQHPRHEIVDGKTNKVLENKIREVSRMVEEVCGMDFDQFTRSVLLAQGSFAAFLQATTDERAPILEQITGTELYSRLSQKVHMRRNEEQQKLVILETEIGAVNLLADEEVTALQNDLAERIISVKKAEKEIETAQNSLNWLTRLAALKGDIAALETEAEQIQNSQQAAEPERLCLSRAQKAYSLQSAFLQLTELRKVQNREGAEREKTAEELAGLTQRRKELQQAHAMAEATVKTVKSEHQKEITLCRQVRELDVKLSDAQETQKALRQRQAATEKQLPAQKEALQNLESAITLKDEECAKIKEYLLQHEKDAGLMEELAGLLELGKASDLLADKAASLQKQLEEAQTSAEQAARQKKKTQELHEKYARDHTVAKDRLAALQKDLEELLEGRSPTDLREEQNRLAEKLHTLEKINRISRQIDSGREELSVIDKQRQEIQTHREENERKRQALPDKISMQKQMVEKQRQVVLLTGRIHDYKEERKRLVHGKPCPLCGALEHPFCNTSPIQRNEQAQELKRLEEILGNLQDSAADLKAESAVITERFDHAQRSREKILTQLKNDEKEYAEMAIILPCPPDAIEAEWARLEGIRRGVEELLHKLDKMAGTLEEARQATEKHKDTVQSSLQALQQTAHAESRAVENLSRLQEQIALVRHDLEDSVNGLSRRLAPYETVQITIDSLGEALTGLGRRQQAWKQQKDREQQILTDLQALRLDRERTRSLLEKMTAEMSTIDEQARLGQERFDTLLAERLKRYQDKDPEEEEKLSAEKVSKADESLASIEREIRILEKEKAVLEERSGSLERSLSKRKKEIEGQEKDLNHALSDKGFADEADFQSAILSEERMTELLATLSRLDKQEVEIATRLASKKESLVQESTKHLTELSMDELKKAIEDKTDALNILQQHIGRLQGKLQDNENQRQKQQGRLEARQRQQQEYRRWQALHDLIGSSDGKKFRNFAQGVTFEIMIDHANRNLQMMTDRYILVRDAEQPLELNVIDTYQAGEIRSTKNLSGGESFIVSLALALGLSGMAGNNVRVDSLFLDEGFGTLDEESLETALETLASLQQEGKIIGIISHVPVLQERIATRIQIFPGPGGNSNLQGPGVTRL